MDDAFIGRHFYRKQIKKKKMELSNLYISCVGILCLTIRVDPYPPIVFEVVGVNENGSFEVEQVV